MAMNFRQFAEEGEAFLKELAGELGCPEDRNRAARVLRTVLHTFRDMIPAEESVEFIAQMPMFLKAVYVERWSLKDQLVVRSMDELISAMRMYEGSVADHDFPTDRDAEKSISVVLKMVHNYVSSGEMDDLRAVLPKKLKPLLDPVLAD